jgi:hypothetical protein
MEDMGKRSEAKPTVLSSITLERQAVFAFFWGLAHFVDEFRQPLRLVADPIGGFLHIIVFALAISVMFKPSSLGRLFSMSLLSSAVVFTQLPITPNHNMILLMGDLAIAVGLFVYSFSKNSELKNWFLDTEPFLRIALLITYGSATIAKFNTGWFNTELSCANTMPTREFGWLPFLVPWETFWFMPFFVGGAELLIWLLPLIRKIRPYALVLAVTFHISLSLTPDSQGLGFAFILFALLVLYLPDSAHQEIYRRGTRTLRKIIDSNKLALVVYGFIALSMFLGFISFIDVNNDIFRFVRYVPMLLLLALFGALIAYHALKHRNQEQVRPAIAVRHWTQLILLIVIVLNSLGPYLGFKTYATMTMYSNLSIANGTTNHLFIPRVPLSDMADDVVTIISSSNERVSSFSQRGLKLTWHELRREMSETPFASIVYERDGEVIMMERASDDPELVTLDPILHRLLGFRPIGEEYVCLW